MSSDAREEVRRAREEVERRSMEFERALDEFLSRYAGAAELLGGGAADPSKIAGIAAEFLSERREDVEDYLYQRGKDLEDGLRRAVDRMVERADAAARGLLDEFFKDAEEVAVKGYELLGKHPFSTGSALFVSGAVFGFFLSKHASRQRLKQAQMGRQVA